MSLTRASTARRLLNMFKEAAGRAVPQRAGSEETRRQILDTALALFPERGIEETTMRDIAGGAGMSLGDAYYYFNSKEAIVGAYYDYVQGDRRLLRALFRYGGEPDHPLSWFGPATRDQRLCSIDVFAEALAGEKLP